MDLFGLSRDENGVGRDGTGKQVYFPLTGNERGQKTSGTLAKDDYQNFRPLYVETTSHQEAAVTGVPTAMGSQFYSSEVGWTPYGTSATCVAQGPSFGVQGAFVTASGGTQGSFGTTSSFGTQGPFVTASVEPTGPFVTTSSFGTQGPFVTTSVEPHGQFMTTSSFGPQGQFVTASNGTQGPFVTTGSSVVQGPYATASSFVTQEPFGSMGIAPAQGQLIEGQFIKPEVTDPNFDYTVPCKRSAEYSFREMKGYSSSMDPACNSDSSNQEGFKLEGSSAGSSPNGKKTEGNSSDGAQDQDIEGRVLAVKMKNRMAAKICRAKKKEYIRCLEERVAELETQNSALMAKLQYYISIE